MEQRHALLRHALLRPILLRPILLRLILRVLLIAATLGALYLVDRAIGRWQGGGPYREEIPRPLAAVRRAPEARHVVLGCSTSNWFAGAVQRGWRLGKNAVVDAHMSDCLQACTMAEARRLAAQGRHFQTATFGVNAFEYCEAYRERRSMQEVDLMPLERSLDLARVYAHSDDPLRYVGGWLLNHVSLVYGNTMWLQRHARKSWFGNEGLDNNWFRLQPPPPRPRKESFRCDYMAADRAFGMAATRGALRALEALADRVQLVVLPDKQNSANSDEARRARELFAREHRELSADFDRVELIELLDPALTKPELFRDGAHLNNKGLKLASASLAQHLASLPALAHPARERVRAEGAPGEALPGEVVPGEIAAPVEAVPAELAPVEAAPGEVAPGESAEPTEPAP